MSDDKKAAATYEVSGIAALIQRVEAATGPDRELDCHIWALAEGWNLSVVRSGTLTATRPGQLERVLGFIDPGSRSNNFNGVGDWIAGIPAYTRSLDAAVSLVEKARGPGNWFVSWPGQAAVFGKWPQEYAYGNSAPLSLILAFLRAVDRETLAATKRLAAARSPQTTSEPST